LFVAFLSLGTLGVPGDAISVVATDTVGWSSFPTPPQYLKGRSPLQLQGAAGSAKPQVQQL